MTAIEFETEEGVPAEPPWVPLPLPPEFQQGGKNEPDGWAVPSWS